MCLLLVIFLHCLQWMLLNSANSTSLWNLIQLSNFVGKNSGELAALNESLQNLLDGIQVMHTTYCLSFRTCY